MTDHRENAMAFVIWREGVSVDWDCTLRDLSDATGMPYFVVRRIVKARGWPVRKDDLGGGGFGLRVSVDAAMRSGYIGARQEG